MYKRTTTAALILAVAMSLLPASLPAYATDKAPAVGSKTAAAVATLTIQTASSTASPTSPVIYVQHTNLEGRQVNLQMAVGTGWKDAGTKTLGKSSAATSFDHRNMGEGTQTYRVVATALDGTKVQSLPVKVAYTPAPKPNISISVSGQDVSVKVLNGHGLTMQLYRVDQGRKAIWQDRVAATSGAVTFKIPVAVATDQLIQVQAAVLAGSTEKASTGIISFRAYAPKKLAMAMPTEKYVKKKSFTFTGDVETGSRVSLQRQSGSSWINTWTSPVLTKGKAIPSASFTFSSETTAVFRAVRTKDGKVLATTAPVTVSFAKSDTFLRSAPNVGLFYNADGGVAAKNSVTHTYFLDYSSTDRTGYLQEYRAGKWVNLQTLTFRKSTGPATARAVTFGTPITHATVTRTYRVHVPATATQKGWTSGSATVRHVNPLHYTGYKKTAYNYIKGYCPNQVITLIGGSVSYANSRTHLIQLSTMLGTGKMMQYVALHECAHIRQFKLYKNDSSMQPRLNAVFGGTGRQGIERAADCMAYTMGADPMYGGSYLRFCSASQQAAARKLVSGVKP